MDHYMRHGKGERGLTYLGVLFFLFLISLAIAKTTEVYSNVSQREKERELYEIGNLYMNAIRDYYNSNLEPQHPKTLSDLLKDSRYLVTRRYLRKVYLDPITNKEFVLIYTKDHRICGVQSTSRKKVLNPHLYALQVNQSYNYSNIEFQYHCDV